MSDDRRTQIIDEDPARADTETVLQIVKTFFDDFARQWANLDLDVAELQRARAGDIQRLEELLAPTGWSRKEALDLLIPFYGYKGIAQTEAAKNLTVKQLLKFRSQIFNVNLNPANPDNKVWIDNPVKDPVKLWAIVLSSIKAHREFSPDELQLLERRQK